MLLVVRIEVVPKFSGLGSFHDPPKRLTRVLRRHVDEGKIDPVVVKRIFEHEIYSDHRKFPLPIAWGPDGTASSPYLARRRPTLAAANNTINPSRALLIES